MVLGPQGQVPVTPAATRRPEDQGGWAAVLGSPIGHSLSPALHRAAAEQLGLGLHYEARETTEQDLRGVAVPALSDPSWRGFSVTMPLKSTILDYAEGLTELGRVVGVVNTLVPRSDGRGPLGHNTDVSGIINALLRAGAPEREGIRAVIIGGGGTATAAAAALRLLGAGECTVLVREPARAQRVVEAARRVGLALCFAPLEEADAVLGAAEVAVSTLPARAFDERAAALHRDLSELALLDVSYDPWPSVLSRRVEALGGRAVSGKEMLLYQAVDQAKLFAGLSLDRPLPDQARVLRAMAGSVGLEPRDYVPREVHALAPVTG